MAQTYRPDRWVMLKIESKEYGVVYKVLASWYGGFGGSDSWKLSSGNTDVKVLDLGYEFLQTSGSTYACHKDSYGMSGYTSSIFNSWLTSAQDGVTISVVPQEDISVETRS